MLEEEEEEDDDDDNRNDEGRVHGKNGEEKVGKLRSGRKRDREVVKVGKEMMYKRRSSSSTSTRSSQRSSQSQQSQPTCDVCLEEFSSRGKIDCCDHKFCYACIDRWGTMGSNTCPICKRRFKEIAKICVKSGKIRRVQPVPNRNLGDSVEPHHHQQQQQQQQSMDSLMGFMQQTYTQMLNPENTISAPYMDFLFNRQRSNIEMQTPPVFMNPTGFHFGSTLMLLPQENPIGTEVVQPQVVSANSNGTTLQPFSFFLGSTATPTANAAPTSSTFTTEIISHPGNLQYPFVTTISTFTVWRTLTQTTYAIATPTMDEQPL